jgi:hypothetical protein
MNPGAGKIEAFTTMGRPALHSYPGAVIGVTAESPVLSLPLTVLDAFRRERISCCYWKSSGRVESVFAGDGDIDLLVAQRDQHRAQAVLLGCGCKRFPSVALRGHPAIESYLGYDESSGRLIHFHLYFRLIVGEPLHKNYRIPWESDLLSRAIPHPALPIKILDPATEAVLLAVRVCLELGRLDPIMLRDRRTKLAGFALDRKRLAGMLDRGQIAERATELLGDRVVGAMLADAFCREETFVRGGGSWRAIRRQLATFRTYNVFEARLRAFARAVQWAAGGFNKSVVHLPRPWNRCAPGGGQVIAFIGIDGCGKTTVNRQVRAWLEREVDVMPLYFGTGGGRPSLLLRPFKLMLPLATRLLKTRPKGASHGNVSNAPPGVLYSMLLMVWATVVAWEKRSKLLAAHRGARRGLVVITDRYPQNQIRSFNDGPLLTRLAWAPRWLRRYEARVYALAERLPPDLVIKLIVTPQTAARREPAMDLEVVRERIAVVPQLRFSGARVISVDAEQPLADVIAAVKREIWRSL